MAAMGFAIMAAMKKTTCALPATILALTATALFADISADFSTETGRIRPELHSAGFGPQICSTTPEIIAEIKSMGFHASRTHDWALLNSAQRVCDYFHIFPLMHLDPHNPSNYVFAQTDYLLKRTREELGHDIFFRLGTSIEHSGTKVHFNSLIPEDFDKVAEIFAGTVRHYNKGWANGYDWGIKYWEIWNEPDGVNNMWCLPDGDGDRWAKDPKKRADFQARSKKRQEFFCKFFVTCLKRLKAEFPDIRVGGPALCNMNEPYFRALLKACKDAGVAPDFISWHHYTKDPKVIMDAIAKGRRICDSYGMTGCELIINEWHYLGPLSWNGIRSNDPKVLDRAWSGPASHNGIDSSCFNLTMLSKFQTSKLDQAYYYGCRNTGTWGYKDNMKQMYKVYYGLKMFGDLVKNYPVLCASAGTNNVTTLAVKSADGSRKAFLVTDYCSRMKEISVSIKGVAPDAPCTVLVHDYKNDAKRVEAKLTDGTLVLPRDGVNSAAYLISF